MTVPAAVRVFEKRSVFKSTLARLEAFHQDPSALRKLTPPPIFIQVHEDRRISFEEGEIDFTLWFGFIPVRWLGRHEPRGGAGFADVQIKGPMASWRHEHIFEPVDGGVALTDRITLSHKPGLAGLFTRLAFDGLPLRFLFFYRHFRTRRAIER